MVNDDVITVAPNPQTQQGSREEPTRNNDCWDFENMGSHLQVTHIDGTVTNVDRDALGTLFSSGSTRAQALASTAAWMSWVAPGNTSVLFHTDLPQSDKFMGSSISFLFVGRLSDLYGRRWIILGTSFLGVAGCVLGSFAINAEILIAANICNGIAAAAQLPLGIAVAELVANQARTRTVALTTLPPIITAVLGTVIVQNHAPEGHPSQWRWGYYAGAFFAFFSFLLYLVVYHPPSYRQLNVAGKTELEMTKHLDFVGVFLYVSGCVLLLLGFCLGASSYPSVGKEVIGTLVGGFAALVLFVLYEAFSTTEQPLMPPKMFKNVHFTSLVTCATFASTIFYVLTILWPFAIGKVFNKRSVDVAWFGVLLVLGATLGIFLAASPKLRGKRVKIQCVVASFLVVALTTPLCTISPGGHQRLIVLLGISASFALGYLVAIVITGVTFVWEAQDIGLASGVLGAMCSLGCAFSRTLFTLLLRKKLEEELTKAVLPAVLSAGLLPETMLQLGAVIREQATKNGNTNLTTFTSLNTTTKLAITNAIQTGYANSLRSIFLFIIPFSVILLIGASFLPDLDQFNPVKVARRLQEPNEYAPQNNREAAEQPGLELSMLGRRVSATEAT
ncbi:fungal trichothecene efflux pump-domain-containing protein [Colletotrichum godetiae]|uniref:Fungal trichothecene efflux pump-domain-containing protein n=1 Tax=Colletotrichum godetiae TaxID=1209918 RepID=A0AAJ0EU56_9PEZI|nr:fungal trichothecene efflux pump-domain-containing protein [Colletotrichum godetiae]KAK1671919.1 fungal trichothecene efflux pump-domain-containing protein [Colletotrichum godetiae]